MPFLVSSTQSDKELVSVLCSHGLFQDVKPKLFVFLHWKFLKRSNSTFCTCIFLSFSVFFPFKKRSQIALRRILGRVKLNIFQTHEIRNFKGILVPINCIFYVHMKITLRIIPFRLLRNPSINFPFNRLTPPDPHSSRGIMESEYVRGANPD